MAAFSPDVLDKARRYLDDDRVRYAEPHVWLVQGSAERPYVVRSDVDPTTRRATLAVCTCRYASRSGGSGSLVPCSHVAAVLLAVRDGLVIPRATCGVVDAPTPAPEPGGLVLVPMCNREWDHTGPHRDGVTGHVWES